MRRIARAACTLGPAAMFALAGAFAAPACNGEFRFDEPPSEGGAGDAATEAGGDGAARDGRCTTDVECQDWGLRCDLSAGVCVQCDEDSHCSGATPRCDTAIHRCVECGSARDCGDAGVCESKTHRCVQQCDETARKCPSTFVCDDDDHRCEQCTGDSDCKVLDPSVPYCDNAIARCVQCLTDTQCTGGARRCDRTRGKCVQCIRSDQCTGGQLCGADGLCFTP